MIKTILNKTIIIAMFAAFTSGCEMINALDTTNQNTSEMNEDMTEMLGNVGDMDLRTEEMNDSMSAMIDAMDRMRDTMSEMNKTMEDMSQTMDDMSSQMGQMNRELDKLGTDGRQGVSLGIRTQAWDRLVDSPDVDAKLAAAGAYHMSFEFQTWKGSGLDTIDRRQDLFYDGIAEYYRNIYGYADRNNWSLNVISKSNEMNVLFALAGTLEKVNTNQRLFLTEGQREASFLTLFKDAVESYSFTRDPSYDLELLPQYLEEAAEFKQLTVYMLNLRHNILTGLVVAKLARMDKSTNRVSELARQGRTLLSWRPNLDEYSQNPGILKRIMFYIEQANQTRSFLCRHEEKGERANTDTVQMRVGPMLKTALNKMKVDSRTLEQLKSKLPNQPELAKKFHQSLIDLRVSSTNDCN